MSYPFTPIRDGDTHRDRLLATDPLRTPGHTLESTSYFLDERALFTGDTLFLAGVGRPDLEASRRAGARTGPAASCVTDAADRAAP